MNLLKAIFISLFVAFAFGLGFYTLWQLYQQEDYGLWLFNGLSVAMIVLYFAMIFLTEVPRTTRHLLMFSLPLVVGSLGVAYLTFSDVGNAQSVIFWNAGILLGWLLYLYWATDFSNRDHLSLKVGTRMPDASLKTVEGLPVNLSQFFETPAIFLFYRGNWCPFCMAQIRELAAEYQKIADLGAHLIYISPQSSGHTKSLARRLKIPATFLVDEDLEAAKALKVFNESGTPFGLEVLGYSRDNVLPTLVVTDAQGIIRYVDLTDNYRIRPEPETYLKILEQF